MQLSEKMNKYLGAVFLVLVYLAGWIGLIYSDFEEDKKFFIGLASAGWLIIMIIIGLDLKYNPKKTAGE